MNQQKRGRGFAGMDPDKQREIAALGGATAHALGKAHKFTAEEAAEAGRKGGIASGLARAKKKAERDQQQNQQEAA